MNQCLLSRHEGIAAAASQFSSGKSFGPAAGIIRIDPCDPFPAHLVSEIASRGVVNLISGHLYAVSASRPFGSLGAGSIDKTIDRAGGADLKDLGLFEKIG